MATPTYNEIRRLIDELRKETKVKARRELGSALYNKLKNENVLRKLVVEATPLKSNWPDEDSIVAKRYRAISLVWSSAIQGAIHVTQSIINGKKVKLTEEDIALPYNLLLASDKANEVLGEPSVAIPILPKKMVRSLLKYCLELLADDNITIGRLKLLEMLTFLCSKPDYVGVFKHHHDVANILGELFTYLTGDVEDKNVEFFNEAAKALDVLVSSAKGLGIEIHIFVDSTISTIAAFFKVYLVGHNKPIRHQAPSLPHLYNTIANILYAHPDHAISPMKRHGRTLLRHAKKCYANAKSPCKEALNSYIAAHLFLSQFIGSIQGKVAGNMGDLGKASLTAEVLEQLVDLVVKDVSYMFEKSKTPSTRQRSLSWSVLDSRQRQHLDLASRLLACAQQEFVSKTQWDIIEDPLEFLLSSVQTPSPGDEALIDQEDLMPPSCPTETITKSPWVQQILRQIACGVDWRGFLAKHLSQQENPPTEASTPLSQYINVVLSPLGGRERSSDTGWSAISQSMSHLAVIGACAELFPAGQCWTSNIFGGSLTLRPIDCITHDVVVCQRCTAYDLAIIVFLLAALLDEHGGSTDNQEAQMWILVTLIKLTVSTSHIYRHRLPVIDDSHVWLAQTWQSVWHVLFRPELRYTEYTKDAGPYKLGEVVLVLIREIVRNKCTDPLLWQQDGMKGKLGTFLHRNQSQVWNLRVFRNAATISSAVPFELISWMCHNVGISDDGIDLIDPIPARSLIADESSCFHGSGLPPSRRQRLIGLGLFLIERSLRSTEGIRTVTVRSVMFAILTLMRGRMPCAQLANGTCGNPDNMDFKFIHTDFLPRVLCQTEDWDWRERCIATLWTKRHSLTPTSYANFFSEFDFAINLRSSWIMAVEARGIDDALKSVDFVSDTEKLQLLCMVKFSFRQMLFFGDGTPSYASVDLWDGDDHAGLFQQLEEPQKSLALKILATFELGIDQLAEDESTNLRSVMTYVFMGFNRLDQIIDAQTQLESLANLSQICQSLHERLSVRPMNFSFPQLSSMTDSCRSMLSLYVRRLTEEPGDTQIRQDSTRQNDDDDLMDDEILESVPVVERSQSRLPTADSSSDEEAQQLDRRKRKRSISFVPSHKTPRSGDRMLRINDLSCAEEVAILLLALEPSVKNCEIVCQALLGADHDLDPVDLNGDVDLRSAGLCLSLLTSPAVLSHGHTTALLSKDVQSPQSEVKDSAITLLHKVIDVIRVNARPTDWMYLNGFQEVASVHSNLVEAPRSLLSSNDQQCLLELMLYKDGTSERPFLRAARMRAATTAFREAREDFHGVLDKHFSGLVKMGMSDDDVHVRRLAYSGVRAALLSLDEKKALNSINKLLCPISISPDPTERVKQCEDWYRQAGIHAAKDERHVCDDFLHTFEIFEADSIRCRAVIAASVTNHDQFIHSIFELSMIALARPELQCACFRALDKVAQIRNYGSVEKMIESESPALLFHWISHDQDSLPLLVTAPSIVRWHSQYSGALEWRGQEIDTESLRLDAFLIFAAKKMHLLVPLSLFHAVHVISTSNPVVDVDETRGLSLLVTSRKLKLLALMSYDDLANEDAMRRGLKRLLHRHVADIQAFCSPMLQSVETSHQQTAQDALNILTSILSIGEVDTRTRTKAQIFVRRLIDLTSFSELLPSILPSHHLPYIDALTSAIASWSHPKRLSGDIFRHVGTNAVASLIRSFAQLNKSPRPSHRRGMWKAIILQCELIQTQTGNDKEKQNCLVFCIHMLTEIILKEKFSLLRPNALSLVKQLLESGMGHGFQVTMVPLVKRLVGACLYVHEQCQKRILKEHRHRATLFLEKIRRSSGLMLIASSSKKIDDVWGWDGTDELQPHLSSSTNFHGNEEEIRGTIVGTYDIIKWVFDNSTHLALDSLAFVLMASPYGIPSDDIALLSSMNDSFAVQRLATCHWDISSQEQPGVEALSMELESTLRNRHSWMMNPSHGGLNLDQRFILAILGQLEYRAYDKGETSIQALEKLIVSLSIISRASCPEKLQISATRCLAKMDPEVILRMHRPSLSQTLLVIDKPEDRAIPQSVKSKCLENLAGCLMSADPVVSQTAVETLEALLVTKCSQQALRLISNESVQSQLGTFCPSGTRKDRNILLSATQLKSITVRAGISECNLECDSWCWKEKLWLCFHKNRVAFEEWVCGLTSSLIVCCVSSRDDGQITHRDDDGEFLWLCQKICAFEHNIALTLFPFVVMYLLGVPGTDSETDFNGCFTKSFTSVLRSTLTHDGIESCESTRKAFQLIVNTVDTLRKTSQARFLARKHVRNVMKIVRKDGTPKSNSSAIDYNAGLPQAALWEGMPYGIMLRLDGLLVAEACIFVNRYASALFFLELFLNAKFMRVGEVFDELPNSIFAETSFRSAASDISGSQQGTASPFPAQEVKATILQVMSLVGYCYKSMGELDAFEAVMTQRVALEFNAFGWNVQQAVESRSDALGLLRSLNVQSDIDEKEKAMIVVDSMEALDLNALLQSYVEGIMTTRPSAELLKDNDLHRLKEKWYENELRKKQWNLLDVHDSQMSSPTALAHLIDFHGNRHEQSQHFRSTDFLDQGFFSAIGSAHGSYLGDDRSSCQSSLEVARRSVISDISRTGGTESPLSGMVEAIHKLRTIESIAGVWGLDSDEKRVAPIASRQFGSTLELMATRLHESAVAPVTLGEESAIGVMWITELATSVAYAKKHALGDLHRENVFESLVSLTCDLAVRARKLERPHMAAEAIQRLHRLLAVHSVGQGNQDDPLDLVLLLRLEESKILESQGDFKEAIRKAQQIVDHLIQKENTSGLLSLHLQHILTNAQLSCGGWLTKYKVRQAGSVLKGYLQPGADRAKSLYDSQPNVENADRTARASLALGQISSSLHAALVIRVQSTEWKQSSSTAHQIAELERCEPLLHDALHRKNKAKKGTPQFDDFTRKWEELYIYCEHLRKDLQRTNEERDNVLTSMQQYLRLAIESYSTALALASTGFDEDLLRPASELISLWFENYKVNNDGTDDINKLLKTVAFEKVPSFRFVPLANQLFSRIEQSDDLRSSVFQSVLQELVFKMCAQHPYHCILPLLALANGKKVGSGVSGRHASAYIENVGNSKVAPASEIISRLRKEAPPYVVGLLASYAILGDSYIHLAGADTSSFHKQVTKDISFSKVYSNTSMALDKCLRKGSGRMMYPPAIFTTVPKLQPDGNYGDGEEDPIGAERVRGFKPVFSITETGLHRPKIVICLGTKGGEFRQLVKGEDEIRQDAIMCQVFTIVNDLMLRRRSTAARKARSKQFHHQLRIATYRVVPLSPASGVLEWVENTVAFGDVIFGRSPRNEDVGLHARYYPKEWNYLVCRRHFVEAPLAVKRETYDVVCRNFSPCFRFFFIERFGHDMMEWHAARMRYTRSVAVSSMVGHILGIGDRHTSNILVHTKTGEVVQIDFGIVFEQGKLLHTPERVPFRLTRNMVDGMGPCGTEGTFVRSSEETMLELRKNSGTLLTILSAVVADPLYKWSVSPVEGMRRQTLENNDSISENVDVSTGSKGEAMRNDQGSDIPDDKNEMGKKALAKINDKLQGYEESTSGEQQGIEGQVQLLINSARDVDNLYRMYPGWSPFV